MLSYLRYTAEYLCQLAKRSEQLALVAVFENAVRYFNCEIRVFSEKLDHYIVKRFAFSSIK
ncbi:hypothetical protein [Candidatus Thiosymbion oneisti]|uniref:hypothetical protein n=1 Tax=Candidatus Thiosymbion oneisti TaxID=589554 RepID=UPI001AAE045F|nr:hypothetical protein [Candidatus Thiosymbion oneisti]